jgi:O-antigen/teichoic acid export membrane protein
VADLRPESEAGRDRPATFRGVARSGLANLIGAAYGAAVNLALLVLVARSLSTHDAGVVFATTSLFVLVEAAARLGVDVSIVHFLAGARARNRDADIVRYLRTGLIPVVVAGAAAALVLVLAAPAILDAALRQASVSHGRALMVVLAAGIPVAAAYDVVVGGTRGLGAVRPTVALERILRPTLQLLFVGAALALGGGPFAVVSAWVAPYVVVALLSGLWLRSLLRDGTAQRGGESPVQFAAFWSFTLPRGLAGIAQIALQRLDILLVAGMRGAAAAAVYTAASRFVVVGQLGNQAISYAVQPKLAGLVALRDLDSARRLFRISTVWLVALTWPLFLVVAVAAPVILDFLGDAYHSGRTVMVLLAGAMLVGSASGLVDIVLITLGKTRWNLADTAAAFAINLTLNLILIPRLGISGAALAWAVSIVVGNVIALVQVGRTFRFLPFSWLSALVAALAGVCFGGLPAAATAAFGLDARTVVASVAAGSAVYLAALYRLRRDLHLDLVLRRRRQGSDAAAPAVQRREDALAGDDA